MEKVCALSAILVFQVLLKVRNKEQEYNRGALVLKIFLYAFKVWLIGMKLSSTDYLKAFTS